MSMIMRLFPAPVFQTIQAQADEVRNSIGQFNTVKTKYSEIEPTTGRTKTQLYDIREGVNPDFDTSSTKLTRPTEA